MPVPPPPTPFPSRPQFFCGGIEEFAELPTTPTATAAAAAAAAARLKHGGRVDVGVAMHACGLLTDLSIDLCLERGARFALCPCCYGQVAASSERPRSGLFREHFALDEFRGLHHLATPLFFRISADFACR